MGHIQLFHEKMREMFRHMEMALPPEMERDIYSVKVDGVIELHFFCDAQGYLNAISYLGKLSEKPSEKLLTKLLSFNSFVPFHPSVAVGVNAEDKTVEVWVRQNLFEITEERGQQFFSLATSAVETVKESLEEKHDISQQSFEESLQYIGQII